MEPAGALSYLPEDHGLTALAAPARGCRGCPLYQHASQTVFGKGTPNARLMLVGEQPGDQEDRAGMPFVGPAGALLSRALAAAEINPELTYQTNAVKHFKFTTKDGRKRRIHQRPSRTEVVACRPWLVAEIQAVRPKVLVCLGATAAQSLIDPALRVSAVRDRILRLPKAAEWQLSPEPLVMTTVHPSAILRVRDDRDNAFAAFVADLHRAYELLS